MLKWSSPECSYRWCRCRRRSRCRAGARRALPPPRAPASRRPARRPALAVTSPAGSVSSSRTRASFWPGSRARRRASGSSRRGEPVERVLDRDQVRERVEPLGAGLQLARRLRSAQQHHARAAPSRAGRCFERLVEHVAVLDHPAARVHAAPHEAALAQLVERRLDRRPRCSCTTGDAVRRLVARRHQRVEAQRVRVRRRALLLEEAAEDTRFFRAEGHGGQPTRAERSGQVGPGQRDRLPRPGGGTRAAGSRTAPSDSRCGVTHWTSNSAAPPAVEELDRVRAARPSTRRWPGGTSTPPRRTRRSPRRRGRRRARRRARSRCCAPSPAGAARRTPSTNDSSIQPCGRAGSAHARITASNAVLTRSSKRRCDRRSDRDTCSPSSGITPRGSGDHHATGPSSPSRIGKSPAPVRGEQRARLEVRADAADLALVRRLGRRQLQRVGGGSIGTGSSIAPATGSRAQRAAIGAASGVIGAGRSVVAHEPLVDRRRAGPALGDGPHDEALARGPCRRTRTRRRRSSSSASSRATLPRSVELDAELLEQPGALRARRSPWPAARARTAARSRCPRPSRTHAAVDDLLLDLVRRAAPARCRRRRRGSTRC